LGLEIVVEVSVLNPRRDDDIVGSGFTRMFSIQKTRPYTHDGYQSGVPELPPDKSLPDEELRRFLSEL
jgi:hypothetical protein